MKKNNTTTVSAATETIATSKRKPSTAVKATKAIEDTKPAVATAVSELSLEASIAELNKKEGDRIATADAIFVHAKKVMTEEKKFRRAAFARGLFNMMEEQGKAAMFKAFLANPHYKVRVIKQDPKSGEYKLVERSVELSFPKLEREYQLACSNDKDSQGNPVPDKSKTLARDKKWELMLNMLVDNIARYNADEIGATAPTSTLEAAQRKAFGFEKTSLKGLMEQANIVANAILPEDLAVKLISVHTKYLVAASTSYRNREIVGSKEEVMVSALFATIDSHLNGTKLVFVSKAKIHKAKND